MNETCKVAHTVYVLGVWGAQIMLGREALLRASQVKIYRVQEAEEQTAEAKSVS